MENMVTPGNSDEPNELLSSGPGGPRRRIPRPFIFATAVVLVASGGIGMSAASAASPTPIPTDPETPVPSVTVTETPTETPVPTLTPTPTPTPTPTAPAAPRVPPLAFPGTLHGELVLPAKDGCGFTVFAQTGEATVLAQDSITVKSQDGFEKVYAISDTTRTLTGRRGNEVRQGDWVTVTATTVGETATVAYVFDLSRPNRNFWRGDSWLSSKQWRPGTRWRTPAICPTPPVPTPTDLPTPPTETPIPTDLPTLPTETPDPTDLPTPPTETPDPTVTPDPTETPEPTETPTTPTPGPTPE
jgi:hypothetical protein